MTFIMCAVYLLCLILEKIDVMSHHWCKGRVAQWLATCARKLNVPGSSPAAEVSSLQQSLN